MLSFVAKKQGFTEAGGVLQTDKAAEVILHDIIDGKIKYYTDVPSEWTKFHSKWKIQHRQSAYLFRLT